MAVGQLRTLLLESRYLVSATEGTVNFCGFSGPATPKLTALFEDAFRD